MSRLPQSTCGLQIRTPEPVGREHRWPTYDSTLSNGSPQTGQSGRGLERQKSSVELFCRSTALGHELSLECRVRCIATARPVSKPARCQ
jgi:hypothetical protein